MLSEGGLLHRIYGLIVRPMGSLINDNLSLIYRIMGEVIILQELVGHCVTCEKRIFCNDGFINGIILEDKTLLCFDCSDEDYNQKNG